MKNKKNIILTVAGVAVIAAIIGICYYNATPEARLKKFYSTANSGDYEAFISFFDAPTQKALMANDQEECSKRKMTLEQLYEERNIQLIEHYTPLNYEPVKTQYINDNNVLILQKVYKNNKLIGTYNQPLTKINGTWYLQQ